MEYDKECMYLKEENENLLLINRILEEELRREVVKKKYIYKNSKCGYQFILQCRCGSGLIKRNKKRSG